MARRDVRQRLFVNVLAAEELGHAERMFLIVAINLPTEYVDGKVRPGSKGMDGQGRFSLHYDYLARALHTSVSNVRKTTQRLADKSRDRRWLDKVYPGTFGRPAGFQMLNVRGDMSYQVTGFRFVPPYESEDPTPRWDTTSPLTYKTPDDLDHKRTSGDSRTAEREVLGSEEHAVHEVAANLLACEAHGWADCPDRECIEARESRSA